MMSGLVNGITVYQAVILNKTAIINKIPAILHTLMGTMKEYCIAKGHKSILQTLTQLVSKINLILFYIYQKLHLRKLSNKI